MIDVLSNSFKLLLAVGLVVGLIAGADSRASAQSGQLAVSVVTPAENETLYAAPQSLTYSVQVSGWITTGNPEPSLVKVRLDIFAGTELFKSATVRARDDGSFSFDVTVNPQGPSGDFTPDQKSCLACHYLSDISLPRGPLLLKITASEPNGNQATAQRHIVVDRSDYATVPVLVVDADKPEQAVSGIPVSAYTRLYLWRARYHAALTDAKGLAQVRVEALAQGPTQYAFRVEPTVVEGTLYESVTPMTATVAPGATTAAPITLQVRGRRGQIKGKLTGNDKTLSPVPLRAIRLPDGMSYSTPLSPDGTFAFADLPIAEYVVAANQDALAAQGYVSLSQRVNLTLMPSATTTLPVVTIQGGSLRGTIREAKGNVLPFAWVTVEQARLVQKVAPDSGAFTLSALPSESVTFVASAPGLYNQAKVLTVSADAATLDFALVRRPETISIPCGRGEIIVPPETQAIIEKEQIILSYGWVWSGGGDCRAPTIRVGENGISLTNAEFAIEYRPDQTAWLFLHSGTASVQSKTSPEAIIVRAGEMLALASCAPWLPVPYDPAVIRELSPVGASPVLPTWEPTLEAQMRDRLAEMGIGVAQATTLITYVFIVLIFVVSPLLILAWWLRRRGGKRFREDGNVHE